ncbi:unnamed protein product [Rotaria magnacalcarata]|uniref:Beta-lactamase-related domain-containing protein n=2 Tax=Rotaria magnacalcarata TaxID=392030 RepID=A0A816L7F0_9BILA|nr:unnamed protein product [Rotaria magnacalcarata]CAF2083566.1 unnamed protein product [Rotaria magnacalcarata]CAF4308479.1 unnamed protein product [Rotaria magnacalcarata]
MYFSSWIWSLLIPAVFCSHCSDFNIQGITAHRWEVIRDIFCDNFIQERDVGASVAIYHQGELVVDLWGGWFDQSRNKFYDNDTLQLVFSTTKGLAAAAVALYVQQGLLDYSALVTKYWPEYGQNGKENTTVADILSHRAGLPDDVSPMEQYLNWTAMIHTLEQQAPLWPPGTAHRYHPFTYGWLAGELVRRVDSKKRTFGQIIKDEIANKLDIEFYVGLPSNQQHRVSPHVLDLNVQMTLDELILIPFHFFNEHRAHRAEMPAVNGISNARSVARLYASLIGDTNDRRYKRLIEKKFMDQATKSNTPQHELAYHELAAPFGMGFILYDKFFTSLAPGTFGHHGAGGSIGFAAPSKNLSFAYVMNEFNAESTAVTDPRVEKILEKIGKIINDSD